MAGTRMQAYARRRGGPKAAWRRAAISLVALLVTFGVKNFTGGGAARSSTSGRGATAATESAQRSSAQRSSTQGSSASTGGSGNRVAPRADVSVDRLRSIGFASPSKLHAHFRKHGAEFGEITESQYLALAQSLRDAKLSSSVLEASQVGGTLSRFDRSSGAFLAFDRDLTIRTFFRPNDGENYFRRAAKRSH